MGCVGAVQNIFDDGDDHRGHERALAEILGDLQRLGQCRPVNCSTSHVTFKGPTAHSCTPVLFLGQFASPGFPFLISS